MLVLSRRQNEKIKIGNDVVITVVEITKNKVRLGIEAPENIEVVRTELAKEWRKQEKEHGNGLERPPT
jgi:carbon storage regulator